MIRFLFGKAGSGKSHIGRLASLRYRIHFHDADEDLPARFRSAIRNRENVADDVRKEYFEHVIATVRHLGLAHEDICVCQALIRNRYRERILEAIPSVEYVWVDAPDHLIASRLERRSGHLAPRDYAEMVNRMFEIPTVPHVRFENGDDPVRFDEQMTAIFGRGR